MCVEFEKNIYMLDIQVGSVRIVTSMAGTLTFLQQLGKLYRAFGVHIKGHQVPEPRLLDCARKVEEIESYLQ